MRFYEIQTIKPINPLTPKQARMAALKRNVDNAKQQLKAEKQRVIQPIRSIGTH